MNGGADVLYVLRTWTYLTLLEEAPSQALCVPFCQCMHYPMVFMLDVVKTSGPVCTVCTFSSTLSPSSPSADARSKLTPVHPLTELVGLQTDHVTSAFVD
jgi:hypothetical protein